MKVGEQEIGRKFYVAEALQRRIHILSGEDGSVIKSINLMPFGVIHPSCVSLHNEHIYIGHVDESSKKYQISKFTLTN